jgi:ribosomal protein S18 acetylase RimI-like enzyme
MSHVLDRPVWNALSQRQSAVAEGGAHALRYMPSIVPFAAARDTGEESLNALAALPRPGESMLLAEIGNIAIPHGFTTILTGPIVQMILKRTPAAVSDARIEPLTEADAAEMLALAKLTKPGPFTLRAQALGQFFGVKIDGRLAAMAGERMKQQGHTEISGICSHPDFRGRGLGRLLSVFMTRRVLDSGETPYLHAYATNATAIGLYETIGYEIRTMLNIALIRPDASVRDQPTALAS